MHGVYARDKQLKRVLQQQPLPVTFLVWLLGQRDQFYSDPRGLWSSLLTEELRLRPDQIANVLRLRRPAAGDATLTGAHAL